MNWTQGKVAEPRPRTLLENSIREGVPVEMVRGAFYFAELFMLYE